MKILITGAGGFLGKRLVQRLAASGHEVVAMVRRDPVGKDAEYFNRPNVNILQQDISHLRPEALPTGVDALFTLAQSSRFREFPAQVHDVLSVNVTANLTLLKWAVESGVKRVVHASSGGIYGGRPGARFNETDLLAVDSPLGFYLGSKLCSEVAFQNFRHFFESAVILRPFFIYGSGQRTDMFIARLIESVREGRAISLQGGDGLRVNPIYVDDAAAAFEKAVDLTGTHVINVAGPDVLSLREVGGVIGRAVGRDPIFEYRDGEAVDYVGDTALANQLLGAAVTGFDAGVAKTTA